MQCGQITDSYRVVTPAFGRDYKNKSDASNAFLGGSDFYLEPEHILISCRDFKPGIKVNIRYGKLRKVTTVTIESR